MIKNTFIIIVGLIFCIVAVNFFIKTFTGPESLFSEVFNSVETTKNKPNDYSIREKTPSGLHLIGPNIDANIPTSNQTVCAQDAYQCPDGTWVGRMGTKCIFYCQGLPVVNR